MLRVCRTATALEVTSALDEAVRRFGAPRVIRVDQGCQFRSRELDLWAYVKGVTLDFSRPGKPTDNAYAEAFNARVRAECLEYALAHDERFGIWGGLSERERRKLKKRAV